MPLKYFILFQMSLDFFKCFKIPLIYRNQFKMSHPSTSVIIRGVHKPAQPANPPRTTPIHPEKSNSQHYFLFFGLLYLQSECLGRIVGWAHNTPQPPTQPAQNRLMFRLLSCRICDCRDHSCFLDLLSVSPFCKLIMPNIYLEIRIPLSSS